MCESGKEVFTDYELFLRSGLDAFMGDEKAMKDWVLDKKENVYKVFLEEVMECLVQRRLVTRRERTDTDGQNIVEYPRTQLLVEKCPEFLKYLLGNIDDISKLPAN